MEAVFKTVYSSKYFSNNLLLDSSHTTNWNYDFLTIIFKCSYNWRFMIISSTTNSVKRTYIGLLKLTSILFLKIFSTSSYNSSFSASGIFISLMLLFLMYCRMLLTFYLTFFGWIVLFLYHLILYYFIWR